MPPRRPKVTNPPPSHEELRNVANQFMRSSTGSSRYPDTQKLQLLLRCLLAHVESGHHVDGKDLRILCGDGHPKGVEVPKDVLPFMETSSRGLQKLVKVGGNSSAGTILQGTTDTIRRGLRWRVEIRQEQDLRLCHLTTWIENASKSSQLVVLAPSYLDPAWTELFLAGVEAQANRHYTSLIHHAYRDHDDVRQCIDNLTKAQHRNAPGSDLLLSANIRGSLVPLRKAVNAGLHVIATGMSSDVVATVRQDDVAIGERLGTWAKALLKRDDVCVMVGAFVTAEQHDPLPERRHGFEHEFGTCGVKLCSLLLEDGHTLRRSGVRTKLLALMKTEPRVRVIVGLDYLAVEAACTALRGRKKQVLVGGVDLTPRNLDMLYDPDSPLKYLVGVDPFAYGRIAVQKGRDLRARDSVRLTPIELAASDQEKLVGFARRRSHDAGNLHRECWGSN